MSEKINKSKKRPDPFLTPFLIHMASFPPERDPEYFGFTDLHGFKDFLIEVIADKNKDKNKGSGLFSRVVF